MKFHILGSVILLALMLSETVAEKPRKLKKVRRPSKPAALEAALDTSASTEDVFSMMEDDDKVSPPPEEKDSEEPEIVDNRVPITDPCSTVHCSAGRVCVVDEDNEPSCACIPECPEEVEPRRKVCSNFNETWDSDCAVYQQRCFCDVGDARCKGDNYKHTHVEYFGACRDMPECSKEEMADFPRRMRDWLYNIMRDLADRKELPNHYLKMELEAENNHTRRWTNSAVWKWCDLDGHPPDRSVSRHELFPIRAPLMALEHCIAPFLNSCDVDDDHRISLEEWAKCLEIEEYDIEMRCEDLEERYR